MNFVIIAIDGAFVFMASSVLSLCLFYYFLSYPTSLIMALCLGLIISIFAIKHLYTKRKVISVQNADKKQFAETMIRLNLMKQSKLLQVFKKACAPNQSVETHKDWFYCEEKCTAYFVRFGFSKVTKTDIVRAFNLIGGGDKAVFFCQDYDSEIKEFAVRFKGKIMLKDGKDAFYLLKDTNLLPNEDFSGVYTEKPHFSKAKELIKRKNAKKFFLFGVCFCFFSFFAPIKTYYLIWGGVMLAYSTFLLIFGKPEDKKE